MPLLTWRPPTKRFSSPPDTNAFLYYFTLPEKPRIAGELCLRVLSNDDLASFESGSDLLNQMVSHECAHPTRRSPKNLNSSVWKFEGRSTCSTANDLDAALSTVMVRIRVNTKNNLLDYQYWYAERSVLTQSAEASFVIVQACNRQGKAGLVNVAENIWIILGVAR